MSSDIIYEITCISRGFSPVALQAAMKALLEIGAADVFFPQTAGASQILSVLCKESKKDAVLAYLSGTFKDCKILFQACPRAVLDRSFYTQETAYGPVRHKVSTGYGTKNDKPEYDDLAKIAVSQNISISGLKKQIKNT